VRASAAAIAGSLEFVIRKRNQVTSVDFAGRDTRRMPAVGKPKPSRKITWKIRYGVGKSPGLSGDLPRSREISAQTPVSPDGGRSRAESHDVMNLRLLTLL
jgi:hypothetical protein